MVDDEANNFPISMSCGLIHCAHRAIRSNVHVPVASTLSGIVCGGSRGGGEGWCWYCDAIAALAVSTAAPSKVRRLSTAAISLLWDRDSRSNNCTTRALKDGCTAAVVSNASRGWIGLGAAGRWWSRVEATVGWCGTMADVSTSKHAAAVAAEAAVAVVPGAAVALGTAPDAVAATSSVTMCPQSDGVESNSERILLLPPPAPLRRRRLRKEVNALWSGAP